MRTTRVRQQRRGIDRGLKHALALLAIGWSALLCASPAARADSNSPPGVVIDHILAGSGMYVGSPSIVILPDGTYVASHDLFGPGSASQTTRVFSSGDHGVTWTQISTIDGQYWSSLFLVGENLYLIGVDHDGGRIVIRESDDGGKGWTNPTDKTKGLLVDGAFHCAPTPVVEHGGRIWRAFETELGFDAFVMSAPDRSNLMDAASWSRSNTVACDKHWLDGTLDNWEEGNVVVAPDGNIVDIIRVDGRGDDEKAAIVHISPDGKTAKFDPAHDFIDFPGGFKKFTIRFDKRTNLYYSLVNWVPPEFQHGDSGMTRNTLALVHSENLTDWTVQAVLLHYPEASHHAFQYADWQLDGDDLIAVSRTAFDDDSIGAHSAHDANYLTFHRFQNFRILSMDQPLPVATPAVVAAAVPAKPPATAPTAIPATVPAAVAAITPAPRDDRPTPAPADAPVFSNDSFDITGDRIDIGSLKVGEKEVSNRNYKWTSVPDTFNGWKFTETSGGQKATIHIKAKRAGVIYAATPVAQKSVDITGWTELPELTLISDDRKKTIVNVFKRKVDKGQELDIPQGNWAGMIVLIPPQ